MHWNASSVEARSAAACIGLGGSIRMWSDRVDFIMLIGECSSLRRLLWLLRAGASRELKCVDGLARLCRFGVGGVGWIGWLAVRVADWLCGRSGPARSIGMASCPDAQEDTIAAGSSRAWSRAIACWRCVQLIVTRTRESAATTTAKSEPGISSCRMRSVGSVVCGRPQLHSTSRERLYVTPREDFARRLTHSLLILVSTPRMISTLAIAPQHTRWSRSPA